MNDNNNNNNNNEIKIPEQFICPISLEIMLDPVICEDGHTYDRSSISKLTNPKSPITRQPINLNKLTPNIALRQLIEKFLEQNNTKSETINQTTKQTTHTPTTKPKTINSQITTSIPTPTPAPTPALTNEQELTIEQFEHLINQMYWKNKKLDKKNSLFYYNENEVFENKYKNNYNDNKFMIYNNKYHF
jgi:hypothetical protein